MNYDYIHKLGHDFIILGLRAQVFKNFSRLPYKMNPDSSIKAVEKEDT